MLIRNDFEVAEPVEKVWQFFQDIPQVAACLPGAELTDDLGGEKYKGRVAVRMGPVRLQFAGTADITERDEAARRVVVHAAGAEEKGRGQASMVVTATLTRSGRGTKVGVTQDLQLSGAAAQYGRGMISDVTAVLMRDFSANLQNRIAAADLAGHRRRLRQQGAGLPRLRLLDPGLDPAGAAGEVDRGQVRQPDLHRLRPGRVPRRRDGAAPATARSSPSGCTPTPTTARSSPTPSRASSRSA